MEYVTPIDPELMERTQRQIATSEVPEKQAAENPAGKRVSHPIFGQGTVIGVPRDREGVIVQFDTIVTPRTFAPGAKLCYVSV